MQKGEGLKILTPNKMLKRLPIALTQIKAGNNSHYGHQLVLLLILMVLEHLK